METASKAPVTSSDATADKSVSVILTKTKVSDILATLQSVTGIVVRRGTMPILSNVMIAKRGAQLEFTSTDLELQMRGSADIGYGDSEVSTTVNARKITDILKALPGEQTVTLTLSGEKLVVTAGKSRFQVQTLPAGEFPLVVQNKDATAALQIEQGILLKLLDQVQYAMANHDIRFYLNGLLFETEGSSVRVVATDGHRLAMAEATLDAPVATTSVILARKTVIELTRLLKQDDGMVDIRLAQNQATFNFHGLELTTKLLEGRFPDYRRVIPANNDVKIMFERSMLLSALQRAELMCSDKFKGVRLAFSTDTLELRASNEQEEAREEIGIDFDGEAFEIGFNVTYLLDAIGNMSGDRVTLSLKDSQGSVLLTEPDSPGLKGVIMPMRI